MAFLFLDCLQALQAQTESGLPPKIFRMWIKPMNKEPVMKGALYMVKDSSVMMSYSLKKEDYNHALSDYSKIDVQSIDVINLRNNHKVLKGILYGGIPMLIIGGIAGYTSIKQANETHNPSDVGTAITRGGSVSGAIIGALVITGIGVGIGALVTCFKTKIHIHGSQQQFDQYRSKLDKRAINPNPIKNAKKTN
jgi:hypothetical protein